MIRQCNQPPIKGESRIISEYPNYSPMLVNHIFFHISGLEWNDQYDIGSILSKCEIIPGKGYSGKEISDHLMQTLGKRPGKLTSIQIFESENSFINSCFLRLCTA